MPRVLILSAPYGSGHDRVAAALAQAFVAEGATVEVRDHFRCFVSPAFARLSTALFWLVLRRAPALWGLAYARAASLPTGSRLMVGMDHLGARALGRYLRASRPDAVVHVHPTPAGALAWLRRRGAAGCPHGLVVTDFVVHAQWIYPDVDRFFVPAEEIRQGLAARGVPAERVVATGIPVDAAFTAPVDRPALRRQLGLDPEVPVVLAMGGMHGWLGGLAEVCAILARLPVRFQAVAVCGRHAGLAEALRARHAGDPRFRILGFVAEMHRVMGAVDVVVTKAGAATCAEALAMERPLLFYRSLPGQERANEAYLAKAGVGVCARDAAELAAGLRVLLEDPGTRARMTAAARRLRRPEAARHVAKEMLALVGAR